MADTSGPESLRPCGHCGLWHAGTCPRVRAVEYYPDGTLKRVEYHDPQTMLLLGLAPDLLREPAGGDRGG